MRLNWKRLLGINSISESELLDYKPAPPVVLNGMRIWLQEIETILNDQPDVRRSYVRVVGIKSPSPRMIAYVIPSEAGNDARSMMLRMKHILPLHLLPEQFVFVDELPLTANGIVDDDRLPLPEPPQREEAIPQSRGERFLLKLWRELLANDGIGLDDDFFALGGTEESAAQLLSRILDSTGVNVSIGQLRENSTLRALAHVLDEAHPASAQETFIELRPGEGNPIFLIPAAARTSLSAMRYVTHLRRGVRVVGLEYPLDLPQLPPPRRLPALAEYFIAQMRSHQPHGPYSLMGNCLGGVLVFEVASQLQRAGETLEHTILIDCGPPKMQDTSRKRSPRHYLKRLTIQLERGILFKTIWGRFRRKVVKPATQRFSLNEDIRRGIKYLWDAKKTYRATGPQDGDILIILNSLSRETERVENWNIMTPNAKIHFVEDTDHLDLFHINSALDSIGRLINEYIERKK